MGRFSRHADEDVPPAQTEVPPTLDEGRFIVTSKRFPEFSDVVISRERAQQIFTTLAETVHLGDVIILLILSLCTIPIARLVRKWRKPEDSFANSFAYHIALIVTQLARITCLVYLIDCIVIIADVSGTEIHGDYDGTKLAKVLYQIWFASWCVKIKQGWIRLIASYSVDKAERVEVYNRVLDTMIMACLALSVMDTLGIDFGAGIKSIWAFGGMGTLVISLACQDVATLFVSGLALSTSARLKKEEEILLGDGTAGMIHSTGMLYTEIRGFDEIVMKIPNTQLANQKMSIVSRGTHCQLKQELRFHHRDMPRLPKLMKDIKKEIAAACPALITDGSKPCRVHVRGINDDGTVKVVIDTRYHVPPTGDVYFDNRDKALRAVSKAILDNKVELAWPIYHIMQEPCAAGP